MITLPVLSGDEVREVVMGPFLDSVTNLPLAYCPTITPSEIVLIKRGDVSLGGPSPYISTSLKQQADNSFDLGHNGDIAQGYISIKLSAADLDTIGSLRIVVSAVPYGVGQYTLPVWEDFEVVSREEYNKHMGISATYREFAPIVIPADPASISVKSVTIIVGPFVDTNGNPVTGLTSDSEAVNNFKYTKIITNDFDVPISTPNEGGIVSEEIDSTIFPGYYKLTIPYQRSAQNMFKTAGKGLLKFENSAYVQLIQPLIIEDVSTRVRSIEAYVSEGNVNSLTFYVDGAIGDDNNSGDDWDAPFQSINKAISLISGKRGIIFVKSGVYLEDVVVPPNVTLYGVYTNNTDTPIEIRGFDSLWGSTSDNPTLTLMEGAKAINIRVGRKLIVSSVLPTAILMKDGSQFIDGTTGGFDVDGTTIISAIGYNCVINGNVLDGSDTMLQGIVLNGADNTIITNNLFNEIPNDMIHGSGFVYNVIIRNNIFGNLMDGYYAAWGDLFVAFSDNKVHFNSANIQKRVTRFVNGINYGQDNVSIAYSVWQYEPRTLTSGADQTMITQIWQSTSGLAGAAMRGTDRVGSISADIISGGTLKKAGVTIKDIEVRDSTVFVTYRDTDGKMKTFSVPFSQDVVIASGGDLI